MEGKKRYIAIILFLLICLMVFTFATTSDEELEGNGSNIQQITDKDTSEKEDEKEETKSEEKEESKKEENKSNSTNSNSTNKDSESSADDEEDLDGTGEVDNSAYDKALEAVEELERLLTDAQANIARDLVEEVTNSDQYKELMERVEDAEDAIDAEELVAKLEQMVKDAAKKADITDAKDFRDEEVTDAVNEIDGENLEDVKEDLLDRIEELSKILDDNNDPTIDGIKDGEYTNLDEVKLTITDENEVEVKVTKDGKEIDYTEKFTEEGTYEVTVVDAAFNDVTKTFTIDRTEPRFEGLTSGQHYDTIKLDVRDSSPVSIMVSQDHDKEIYIENGTEIVSDGTYRIVATDEAGNKKEIWVAIDNTLPTIEPDVEYTNEKGLKVTIADKFLMTVTINGKEYTRADFNKGKNNEYFTMDYTLEEDGEYTIIAKDKKGLSVEKTIILDTVKPAFDNLASREVDTDYYKVEVTDATPVKIYVSKDHKAFEEIQEGYELTEEGTYQLKAVDAAGNEFTTWIHIDKTEPTITVTPDAEYIKVCPTIEVFDRYLSKVTIDGKVYDRTGNDFTKNTKNENFKLNVTLEDCEDGLHTITAVDKKGHSVTKTFTVDTKAPTYKFYKEGSSLDKDEIQPKIIDGKLYFNQNVRVVFEEKTSYFTQYIHNDFVNNEKETTIKRWQRDTKNDGEHTMKVTDALGHATEVTFTVDTKAPTYKFYKEGSSLDKDEIQPKIIDGKLYFDQNVRVVFEEETTYFTQYIHNDFVNNENKTTIKRWQREATNDGEHTMKVTDALGHVTEVTFTVDQTKAGIDIQNQLDKWVNKPHTINIVVTEANLKDIYYDWTGTHKETNSDANREKFMSNKEAVAPELIKDNGDGTYTVTITTDFEGSKILVVKVTDKAGNISTSASKWFRIDTTDPVATPSYTELTVEGDKNGKFDNYPTFEVTDNSKQKVKKEVISEKVDITKVGLYELKYKFTDIAGNVTYVTIPVTVVDTTAPKVTKVTGKQVSKGQYTKKQEITVTIEENVELDKVYYAFITDTKDNEKEILNALKNAEAIDSSLIKENEDGTYSFAINTNFEGSRRLIVKAVDKEGNVSGYQTKGWYRIDNVPPVMNKLQVWNKTDNSNLYVKNGTELRILVEFNETLGTLPVLKIAGYEDVQFKSSGNNIYAADIKLKENEKTLKQGLLEFTISGHKDIAGNDGVTITHLQANQNVTYDRTNPDLTITQSIGQNPGVCAADKSPNTTVIKSADKEWVITAQKDEHGTYWNCNGIGFLGEGEYTITTTDAAGNVSTGKTIIDLTAPVATPSYTEKTIEVNSVEEFTDFPTFEITDKYTKNIEAKLVSGNVDPTNVGSYELVYRATDEAGNYSEVTVTVNVVDTTAPEVEPSYTTKKVKEDSADEFTDFPTFKVTDNSKKDVKQELISGSVNIHKVGIYKLVYRFTDESGNYTEKTIVITVVDETAPTVDGLVNGAYYNTKDTHAIPVASDKNGAILMAKTNLGDVELKALIQNEKELKQVGTYTIYAVDTFGNKSEEYTVHIDPYDPKILVLDRIENISGAYLPIKPVILEHNIDKIEVTLNGKAIDYKAGDQLTEDGEYVMVVTDKAGNSTTVEFTMDSVAPTMLVSPTSLGVVDSLDLNDVNNVTGLILSEDAEFQLLKAGKNVTVLDKTIPIYEYTKLPEDGIINEEGDYILIAYDKAYNLTAVKFVVDRTAPSINAEDGKFYTSLTLDVKDKNLSTITVKKQGSLIPTVVENGHVIDKDGTYEITAKDIVGVNPLFGKDVQADHTTTITIHIDTNAPTSNVVEGGVYKKVTAAVADAHLDEESITINGKKYDGKEITEEGNYVLEAKDLAGNTLTVNFEVDKTPITISGAKEFNNLSVEVEVNSKDENPTIELNGVEVGKEFTASTEGINEVVVVDKWGNSETVTFTIDTIKPVINNPVKLIKEHTTVGAVKGTSIPVVATVTDANPTETEVLPIVSHDKLGELGQLSSISTTKAEVGTYTLTYNTVDKAGNEAEQVELTVEVFVDDYVLSFNNIKTEYNYGESIPSLTFADLKLVSDEETIALADGDITFDKKTSDMVKVGNYTVKAELTKVIDGKKVVRTATVTFEIKPIQAKITFVKTDGYGEINGDTGTFQYEFDGNSNPFTATVEGILDADKDDIVVTVTYNKDELKPGIGFKATATINNDNYYLVGDTFDFDIMKATATVELPTEIDGEVTVTNRNGIDISKYATITRNTDGKATGTQTNKECKEWGLFKCNKYETVTKNIQIDYTTIQVKSNDYMNVATNNIDLGDIINDILEEKGINIPGLSNAIDYEKIIQLLDLANYSMIGDAVEAIEVPTEGTSRVYITNVDITEIKN